jgi:hypothetical protein
MNTLHKITSALGLKVIFQKVLAYDPDAVIITEEKMFYTPYKKKFEEKIIIKITKFRN